MSVPKPPITQSHKTPGSRIPRSPAPLPRDIVDIGYKRRSGFERKRKRPWKKPKNPSFLRKYGLIRNVVVKIPSWTVNIKVFLLNVFHMMVHMLQLTTLTVEGSSLLAPSTGSVGEDSATRKNALRLLGALFYDCILGFCVALTTLTWATGLPHPSSNILGTLRRLALLQSATGSVLHLSSVARWQRRSSRYDVPPFFLLVAYCIIPWCGLNMYLLGLDVGLNQHTSLASDLGILAVLFGGRAVFFGRYGLTRMPRARYSLQAWATDAIVLISLVAIFDWGILRSPWLEKKKNWKYVVTISNLVWPFFFWEQILATFREDDGATGPVGAEQEEFDTSGTAATAASLGKTRIPGAVDGGGDFTKGSRQRRNRSSGSQFPGVIRQRPRRGGIAAKTAEPTVDDGAEAENEKEDDVHHGSEGDISPDE